MAATRRDMEDDMMEIGVLKFDGRYSAEDALKTVVDAQADHNPWLHEVGVVSRPLIGRLRIAASFPEGTKTYRESDLANAVADLGAYTGYFVSALAGPLRSMFATVNAAAAAGDRGSELEERLFHINEIKEQLPRDSSALVLVADADTIDAMVELFEPYEPKVVRHDVQDELRQRLEAVHRRLVQEKAAQAEQEGAPALH
jgi:uncharacterized membrane protein